MADDRDFKDFGAGERYNSYQNFKGEKIIPKYVYESMSDERKESHHLDCILRQLGKIPLDKLKKLTSFNIREDRDQIITEISLWI